MWTLFAQTASDCRFYYFLLNLGVGIITGFSVLNSIVQAYELLKMRLASLKTDGNIDFFFRNEAAVMRASDACVLKSCQVVV